MRRGHVPPAAALHRMHLGATCEWRDSAGCGTVYTFTVIRQHGQPYLPGPLFRTWSP